MNTLPVYLTALAVLATPFAAREASADACSPRIVQDETTFPMRSQLRGQKGTVFMEIVIDERGEPAQVRLLDSSGHRLLDRAAQRSALNHWRFDVAACDRKDLPITHRIAVEYRNEEY